jgi:hypothetical protein
MRVIKGIYIVVAAVCFFALLLVLVPIGLLCGAKFDEF